MEKMTSEERETERLLERFARSWEADSAPADPKTFLASFREKLDELREPGMAPAVVVGMAPLRRRRADRVSVRAWRIASGVAIAAAAFAAVLVLAPFQRESAAAVLFTRGEVTITGPGKLSRTMTVATSASSQGVVAVDQNRISLLLNQDSTLDIVDQDTVRLASGEVWTSVKKDSGFFEVLTPHGRVVVHGTTFGVRVTAEETVVSLAEGKVSVLSVGREDALTPNMSATIAGAGKAALMMPVDEPVPAWVQVLHDAYINHEMSRYYPSLKPE